MPKLKDIMILLWPTTKFVIHDLDTGLHTDTLLATDSGEANYLYQTQTVMDKVVKEMYIPNPNTDGVLHIGVQEASPKGAKNGK